MAERWHSPPTYLSTPSRSRNLDSLNFRDPLIRVIQSGDLYKVTKLINSKNVNRKLKTQDEYGYSTNTATPLHVAVEHDHVRIVEYLLKVGADVDKEDSSRRTPLNVAVSKKNTVILDLLCKHTKKEDSRIISFIIMGYTDEVTKLMNSENVNRELKTEDRYDDFTTTTPLHVAVEHDHVSIVEHLLKVGADVDKENLSMRTPLDVAVSKGNPHIFMLLCAHTANNGAGISFLIRGGHIAQVTELINSKNVNRKLKIQERDGFFTSTTTTPLHVAVEYHRVSIVEYLFKVGADVDKEDSSGRTPLDVAVSKKNTVIVDLLCKHAKREDSRIISFIIMGYTHKVSELINSENVNRELKTQDRYDFSTTTPLHVAVEHGHVRIVEYLLKVGADVDKKYSSGRTPLDVAVSKKNTVILDLLCKHTKKEDSRIISFIIMGYTDEVTELINSENVNREMETQDRYGHFTTTTPLYVAVENDNVRIVEQLLKVGADIDKENLSMRTPLDVAVSKKNLTIIMLLCAHTANNSTGISFLIREGHIAQITELINRENVNRELKIRDRHGHFNTSTATPLHVAVKHDHVRIVEYLLKVGADVDKEDSSRRTPSDVAVSKKNAPLLKLLCKRDQETVFQIKEGNIEQVKRLVNSENVNRTLKTAVQCNYTAATPLHVAAEHGQVRIVEYLLKVGADVDKEDSSGRTPLDVAVSKKNAPLLKLLCKHDQETVFQMKEGNIEQMERLINSENVNRALKTAVQCNYTTTTPLHVAVENGHVNIVKHLLKVGADVDKEDSSGRTPLDVAVDKKQAMVINLIVDYYSGAKTKQLSSKRSLLHMTAEKGYVDVCKQLLKKGINVNEKDDKGCTALHFAENPMVAKLLLDSGAEVDIQDKQKRTPLRQATLRGSTAVCQTLVKRGADVTMKDKKGNTVVDSAFKNHPGNDELLRTLKAPNKQKKIKKIAKNKEKNAQITNVENTAISETLYPEAKQISSDVEENDKNAEKVDILLQSWLEPYLEAIDKHGSVSVNVVRCVLIGSSAVGKTCLKYLLVYNQSKEIDTSTGVLERPEVVAVTSEQFLVEEGSSVWTLVTDSKMEGSIRRIVKDKEYDKKEAYPVISDPGDHGSLAEENEIIEKLVLLPAEVEVPPHLESSIPTETPIVTPTKEDTPPPMATPVCSPLDEASKAKASLIKAREEVLENTNLEELKLKEKTFVHLLDTGGQPTFQDSLPFLLTLPATYIQVFNSSKELSQPVELTYRPDSQTCESLPCSESVWDMMQHSLSSIYVTSLRQPELPSEIKLPNLQIFLVATFKDALSAMPNHREALEKIKAQLKGLEDKPYHEHLVCDPENVAFLVNNLMYQNIMNESDLKKDQDYLNKLRSLISSKNGCVQLKMPVMWFLLDLITKRIPQILLRYDDLLEFCLDSKYIDRDLADRQFLAMLRLFHLFGFFAYFELKGSPESNWVCTNATILYKEISKLLAIQYHPEFPVAKATRRYKQTGIIKMEDHEDLFEEVGIRPDIPSEWLLEVLHFLHLSAKIEQREYFLPIVLPYGTTPVPDLPVVRSICFAYNFRRKKFSKDLLDLPRGIFCKLAVHLADKKDWRSCPEESDRSTIRFLYGSLEVYLMEKPGRNEVAIFSSEGTLTNDSQADHLKYLHESCKLIKKDLEEGIQKVSQSLIGGEFLKRVNLHIGFLCNCGKGTTHLATLSENKGSFVLCCSRPKGKPRKSDVRWKIWCQPVGVDDAVFALKPYSANQDQYLVLEGKTESQQGVRSSVVAKTGQMTNFTTGGQVTASKGNAASVESIIKSMYTDLLDKLNLPQLCDHLFEKNMITDDLKERIEKATCRDANKLYVNHLKANRTISTLKQFAQLLVDTSEKLCNEVHKEVGRALLDRISTAASSTTSSTQSTLSEQSVLKDVSQSPDMGDILNERIRSFLCSSLFHDYFHSKCDVRRISTSLRLNGVIGPKDLCKMAPSLPVSAANTELFILLDSEPSISKLKALSESLTRDEEHAPHRELAKRIDKFLRSI